jgi:hypothetical protein
VELGFKIWGNQIEKKKKKKIGGDKTKKIKKFRGKSLNFFFFFLGEKPLQDEPDMSYMTDNF